MIAGIRPEEIKALREESDWVAEQLQRLEHTVFYLNRSRGRQPTATPEPPA